MYPPSVLTGTHEGGVLLPHLMGEHALRLREPVRPAQGSSFKRFKARQPGSSQYIFQQYKHWGPSPVPSGSAAEGLVPAQGP